MGEDFIIHKVFPSILKKGKTNLKLSAEIIKDAKMMFKKYTIFFIYSELAGSLFSGITLKL